ncbi:MAG: ABC transporter substrate-binding protein [Oscillospiraceae bacterium]|jgi:raffinose/stachyose/melibiose transport system substrate-binding protein|nr:ABC transporter substrate-binding protein [Oscillospiraceae bacterium]
MLAVAGRVIMMILTVLYTFLSAASCSAQPEPAGLPVQDAPLETPDKILTILQSREGISLSLQRAAERFVSLNPGVTIRVQTVAGESSYRTALRSRLLSGEDVGLFHIFGHQDMMELREHLDDLSDLSWARRAQADSILPVVDAQAVLGVPYALEGMGLIYNRDIFLAAGVDIASASSPEALSEVFSALREEMYMGNLIEAYPGLKAVTALPAQDYSYLGRMLADVLLTGEFSSPPQAANAPFLAFVGEEDAEEYLALLAGGASMGSGWQGLLTSTRADQVESGLAAGRVAVVHQSTGVYKNVLALSGDIAAALSLLPIPLSEEEESVIYTEAPAFWAVNAAASKEAKAIARDFLSFLYQSEEGGKLLAEDFGIVSPYLEYYTPTQSPLDGELMRYISEGRFKPRYWREFPKGWDTGAAAVILRRYLGEPDYPWEEAVRQMKEDWTVLRG